MMAGGIPAGIYITNSSDTCHYISSHSMANIILCDSNSQLKKYVNVSINKLPHLKAFVLWGSESIDTDIASSLPVKVYTWNEFLEIGAHVNDKDVLARMNSIRPGHCCTLIYTSGTTGPPKAVMLSHDNVTWTVKIFASEYVLHGTKPGRLVSYLPLSHVAAQMIDIYYSLYSCSTTYFAQPDALKGSLTKTLVDVKPTVFFAVPRVW
jgi:long-chain-fatty-acid--CoA ligase ACSBG